MKVIWTELVKSDDGQLTHKLNERTQCVYTAKNIYKYKENVKLELVCMYTNPQETMSKEYSYSNRIGPVSLNNLILV